ncbi:putative protein kinase CAMK-CDPK family [Helianthus annuus]|nr:putative protein kinase CAMK-CDPK family [Helianthus annuus]KAJ0679684.1 putative protein kinase CAMK-CDPK family [Helianthus annuus]
MTAAIAIEDVRREVKILIGHNNLLVKFYDAYEVHEKVYVVMELCEGGELLDRILASDSIHHTTNITEFNNGIFDKLMEESKELGNHVDEIQTKNIDDFQKAYEEQSRSDAQKLIADVTSLVSSHMSRQAN